MRYIIALILFIHGLVHLFGFARAAPMKLNGHEKISLLATPNWQGQLWLLACLLFLAAVFSLLNGKKWWWMPGLFAVLISQVIIVIYWKEAHWGTLVNLLAMAILVPAYGSWRFSGMVNKEIRDFISTTNNTTILTREMLAPLPPLIQKWLIHSGAVGKPLIQNIYLKQQGELRLSAKAKWMPFSSEQYTRIDYPGFIWIAKVKTAPFLHLRGRDKFQNGKGAMLIKLASVITLANNSGKKIDQGAMVRYMAEMAWYPSAALAPYMNWEQLDDVTAKAIMNIDGLTVSGIFGFDFDGNVISFEALRYYQRKKSSALEKWQVRMPAEGQKDFGSIRIPAISEVNWKLKEGDFNWFRLEIKELLYNPITIPKPG